MKIALILLLTLFSLASFAKAKKYSTNQAIVCRDDRWKIISAELYDFYEARVLRGIKIEIGSPEVDYKKKIDIALDRLKGLDRRRARIYSSRASGMTSSFLFKKNIQIVKGSRSGDMMFPVGCEIETVIRKSKDLPDNKSYLVSRDIWDKFDNNSKAGLILHESMWKWYFITVEYRIYNRYFVRVLNSLISSDFIDTFSKSEYDKFIKEITKGTLI